VAIDAAALAREILDAYARRQAIAIPPSARDGGLDLASAYAVESEIVRLRRAEGRTVAGLKAGFANKAVWRALKLETLVWAHMYDDTVHHAAGNAAPLPIDRMFAPKIEPEIVFRLKRPLGATDGPAAALEAVESIALGFEIIDCVFADWKFQPVDFVASKGLHAALIVGDALAVHPGNIPALVEQLPVFTVKLMKNGQIVAEGGGRNVLRSPASCLAELASAHAKAAGSAPLPAGTLISSGTMTDPQLIARGDQWTAELAGLDLPPLSVRIS
jgi:2-oxo-3-hexenedioate decarboxylase